MRTRHDATDLYCDGISPRFFWENKLGPRSGFGLFGRKAQHIKGLDLSELEWRALAAATKESGDPAKRQEAVKALTSLIPRLKHTASEAQ